MTSKTNRVAKRIFINQPRPSHSRNATTRWSLNPCRSVVAASLGASARHAQIHEGLSGLKPHIPTAETNDNNDEHVGSITPMHHAQAIAPILWRRDWWLLWMGVPITQILHPTPAAFSDLIVRRHRIEDELCLRPDVARPRRRCFCHYEAPLFTPAEQLATSLSAPRPTLPITLEHPERGDIKDDVVRNSVRREPGPAQEQ